MQDLLLGWLIEYITERTLYSLSMRCADCTKSPAGFFRNTYCSPFPSAIKYVGFDYIYIIILKVEKERERKVGDDGCQ